MKTRHKLFLAMVLGLAAYPFLTAAFHHSRKITLGNGNQSGWLYRVTSESGINGQLFIFWEDKTPADTLLVAACLRGHNVKCEMASATGETGPLQGAEGVLICSDGKVRAMRFDVVEGMPLNPLVVGSLRVKPGIGQQDMSLLHIADKLKFQGSVDASPCLVEEQWTADLQALQVLDQGRT